MFYTLLTVFKTYYCFTMKEKFILYTNDNVYINSFNFVFLIVGRGKVEDIHIDFGIMERLRSFLLKELEPLPISDILLEEGEFSVSDNDAIENKRGRRKRAEALYAKLVQRQSVSTLKTFLFALREKEEKFILDEISEFSGEQSPRDPVPSKLLFLLFYIYRYIQIRLTNTKKRHKPASLIRVLLVMLFY